MPYLLRDWKAHNATITALAALGDQQILSASADGTLKRWKLDRERPLLACSGHKASVLNVLVTDDRQRICSAAEDGTLCIWDARTGELLQERRLREGARKVLLSPNGRAAVAAVDRTLILCHMDGPTGEKLLGEHRGPISAIHATQDWSHLVSTDMDGELMLWDLARHTCLDKFQMDAGFVAVDLNKQAGSLRVALGDDAGSVWCLLARI